MTPDQERQKPRPIYESVDFEAIDPAQWSGDKDFRIKRIQGIFRPLISRQLSTLTENGIDFAAKVASRLNQLCNLSLEEAEIESITLYFKGSHDVNNCSMGRHSQETIQAANAILNALCPELGLEVTDGHEKVIQKAKQASQLGLAAIYDEEATWILFPTVIPEIAISYFDGMLSIGASHIVTKEE